MSATRLRSFAKVRMAEVAARQCGRIRADQLREAGVSEATIRNWVADGYLHRQLPGVYAVGHTADSVQSQLAAALLYAGHGAMLSHGTAAWWWGLVKYPPPLIHVSTPSRRASISGVHIHGRRKLARTYHKGLPVTTIAQTLLDFAIDAKRELLRFALANADYHDLLHLRALDAVCGQGAPGSARLREALAMHRPELAYTRSEFERRFVSFCDRYGIPIPTFNFYVDGHLVDAVWRDRKVIVELDGLDSHRTRAQLENDHRRDLELRAAGWTILRYTWYQLVETPDAVAADLERHLRR